ncbi:hypothetical protein MOC90_06055 [Bacillus spizizenii]|nr:hypothetical protein [Bacillus spizizenii]MCY8219376.1 hypothetical protein [Bacillus spizizenii]MCY8362100.1 hypothetical protein [Bacillus spizizenii]MCY8369032.1 hypothetical protein [Bacillus spizizenii]
MKDSFISAIASVLGMFVTGGFGYLVARNSSKKDLTINDRQLLSEDEKQFRTELKEMMLAYQDQVKELTSEVDRLTKSNLSLETQVQQLTTRNEALERQVHSLTMVNNQLREELQRRG